MPSHPPKLAEALAAASRDTMVGDLATRLVTVTDPGYLHWDDLRRRTAPDGLSHLAWWALLKLRRLPARAVPLVDTHRKPFTLMTSHDLIVQRLHRIDTLAGAHVAMAEQVTTPSNRDRYLVRSLIDEAITSSQLEGAATTREVAHEMLRQSRKPRDQGERMIFNNFMTMRRIVELRDQPLTPRLVLELHALVTADTLNKPDGAGRLRRSDEPITVEDNYGEVLHLPPPAHELGARLELMCAFANGKTPEGFIHPALRAIILHFWLAWEHPFIDGNGRTARALFYWAMLRQGYWLFEFISISEIILKAPAKYGRAFLLTETDDNDLTYFALYHLEVIDKAIESLHTWIAQRAQSLRSVEDILRGASTLFNHRQRSLLAHAVRHPSEPLTIAAHQSMQQVVYETARTDLMGLVEQGLLAMRKVGRKMVFAAVPDLERRLIALGEAHPF